MRLVRSYLWGCSAVFIRWVRCWNCRRARLDAWLAGHTTRDRERAGRPSPGLSVSDCAGGGFDFAEGVADALEVAQVGDGVFVAVSPNVLACDGFVGGEDFGEDEHLGA